MNSKTLRLLYQKLMLLSLAIMAVLAGRAGAQTPDPQPGVWSGTVVVKRTLPVLGYNRVATMRIIGLIHDYGDGPVLVYAQQNPPDALQPITIEYFGPLVLGAFRSASGQPIEEGSKVDLWHPVSAFDLVVQPKTLKFIRSKTSNQLVSLSYKAKGRENETFAGREVPVEVSVNLAWKRPVPAE